MERARTRGELRSVITARRSAGAEIALVPTMGNLHEGHLALVRAARAEADCVVTSIYVNPAQFGVGEDFERYPRTEETDLRLLESAGCDIAFVPDPCTMYPFGLEQAVRVQAAPSLAGDLEGAIRPGHFDGVLTVVARLFNLVSPQLAVFGEKDYQQWLVIRRMVDDLGFGLRLLAVPTVRDSDGLALSSRNRYLQPGQMEAARLLNVVLQAAADRLAATPGELAGVEREAERRLAEAGLVVDYVAVRRADDLGIPGPGDRDLRVLAAARCGATRLIDNRPATRVCIPDD